MSLFKTISDHLMSRYVVYLTIGFLTLLHFQESPWKRSSVIKDDIVHYYSYLPATFIKEDLSLSFYHENPAYYYENRMFWPLVADNGALTIKMTMGMSYLYFPFFVIAQKTAAFQGINSNGFLPINHQWVQLSLLFYLFFGLFFLHKYLSQKFDNLSASFTIVAIAFGTNAFCFSTLKAPMSHMYTFSILSALIYFNESWYQKPRYWKAILLGLLAGLLVLIRPTNMILLLWIPLFKVLSWESLKQNLRFIFIQHWKNTVLFILAALLVVSPQLLYWKEMTGEFFYHSYGDEGFFFEHPHILKFLFGFRKGWFIYTPLMLIAVIGYYHVYRKYRSYFWGSFLPVAFLIYVNASWWCWWFGGSFGSRPMIDLYPFLAFPLTAVLAYFIHQHTTWKRYVFMGLLFLLIGLNLKQTIQYQFGFIHYDSMTKEAYFEHFFAREYSKDFNKKLRQPDYEGAMKKGREYQNSQEE